MLAGLPAHAQMSEQVLGDLEYLARQISTCYAAGQMDFGQRVLQRRFVEGYLSLCDAVAEQRTRIELDFRYIPERHESCELTQFFEVKNSLITSRSRGVC